MLNPAPNLWKNLDLTAKYAQLNTLRKLALDVSFVNSQANILKLIDARTKSLEIDILSLFVEEVQHPSLLKVESGSTA